MYYINLSFYIQMSVCSSLAVNFNAPHKKIISYYTNIILCKFVINFFCIFFNWRQNLFAKKITYRKKLLGGGGQILRKNMCIFKKLTKPMPLVLCISLIYLHCFSILTPMHAVSWYLLLYFNPLHLNKGWTHSFLKCNVDSKIILISTIINSSSQNWQDYIISNGCAHPLIMRDLCA